MFFVINKEKITAYAVSVFTVIVLFVMAGILMPKDNTIETSSNVANQIENEKENVNSNKNEMKINE